MLIAFAIISIGVFLVSLQLLIPELPFAMAAEAARVIGTLLIAFGTVALWRVLSGILWLSSALGCALLLAPLWITDAGASGNVVFVITGMLVLGLSLIGTLGRQPLGFGGGWSSLWREDPFWTKVSWG